jgi:membrane-associated phospholipid phosphatase
MLFQIIKACCKGRARLTFESLEKRYTMTGWHNAELPRDVDGSQSVSATDALVIINWLNRSGSMPLRSSDYQFDTPCLDVNNDGFLSAIDALSVINAINRNQRPLVLAVSNLPADDSNSNGVILQDSITLSGQTGPFAKVTIEVAHDLFLRKYKLWTGTANEDGFFSAVLSIQPGLNQFTIDSRDEIGRQKSLDRTWYGGDVVTDWNATLLNAVRDWTSTSNDPYPNRIVNSRPPIVTRNLALLHIAMFDAANAVEGTYESYLPSPPNDPLADPTAAASSAAYHVAITMYPDRDEVPVFEATLAASLKTIPDGDSKERGLRLGQQIATQLLQSRASDGASSPSSYTPAGLAGHWSRSSPDFTPPELPHWGKVNPFAIHNVTAFRAPPPPSLNSAEYASAVDEVLRLGRLDSTERTLEQTNIATFWADGAGTATPPGHWNRIASSVLMQRSISIVEKTRTLALLNIALADAAIAAWDVKYLYDIWRPLHAIQRAGEDGNASTQPDPTWLPLLKTPAHPSYVSGHSTFSAAGATILTQLLGNDVKFYSTNDPLSGLTQRPLAPDLLLIRHFDSFWQAAEEAGMSRIYGGIHYSFDNTAGQILGQAVAKAVIDTKLRAL